MQAEVAQGGRSLQLAHSRIAGLDRRLADATAGVLPRPFELLKSICHQACSSPIGALRPWIGTSPIPLCDNICTPQTNRFAIPILALTMLFGFRTKAGEFLPCRGDSRTQHGRSGSSGGGSPLLGGGGRGGGGPRAAHRTERAAGGL